MLTEHCPTDATETDASSAFSGGGGGGIPEGIGGFAGDAETHTHAAAMTANSTDRISYDVLSSLGKRM